MRAKNELILPPEEKAPGIPKAKSLVVKEDLTKKFGIIQANIDKYEEISTKIKVSDSDTLVIAENHATTIQGMLNNIETVRKTVKGPFYETVKAIDAYAKILKDPLDRAKKRISIELTGYKEVQQAAARLEAETAEKERENRETAKLAEIEKLGRIKKQMYARIYGGVFYVKSGERKGNAGCIVPDDCTKVEVFLRDRFPKPAEFVYLTGEAEEALAEGLKDLREHHANLIDLQSASQAMRDEAQGKINEAKLKAEVEVADDSETLKKQTAKETRKDEIQSEKSIKEAGKGIREFVKFTIEDPDAVPADFKIVDERLINEYLAKNKDRIKDGLKKQKQPIPGITFYVDSKFITR